MFRLGSDLKFPAALRKPAFGRILYPQARNPAILPICRSSPILLPTWLAHGSVMPLGGEKRPAGCYGPARFGVAPSGGI